MRERNIWNLHERCQPKSQDPGFLVRVWDSVKRPVGEVVQNATYSAIHNVGWDMAKPWGTDWPEEVDWR